MPQNRCPFDATWLPFGMMIGCALSIGILLPLTGSVLITAGAGILLGAVLGIVLGRRP